MSHSEQRGKGQHRPSNKSNILPQANLSSESFDAFENATAQIPVEGRLGGIDYGTVRIGVATCDPSQSWVTPYDTYQSRNPNLDASYFRELAASQNLVGWVIGLPVHCDGQESQKSKEVRKFATWLADATNLPCCFYDERFSTREARRLLEDSGLGYRKKKKRLDRLAAHLILSHFLDFRRHQPADGRAESSSTAPLED